MQESQDADAKPPRGGGRRRLVADAALRVLADAGSRGLTHRAVDEEAGLPQGSTSNVFRSRAALLEGALERHVELDLMAAGPGPAAAEPPELSREAVAELIVAGLEAVISQQRSLTVARYELLLESTRREELREPIRAARNRFARATRGILTASGCTNPERHTKQLLAVLDGIVLADLHGEDATLTHDELDELVRRHLDSC